MKAYSLNLTNKRKLKSHIYRDGCEEEKRDQLFKKTDVALTSNPMYTKNCEAQLKDT